MSILLTPCIPLKARATALEAPLTNVSALKKGVSGATHLPRLVPGATITMHVPVIQERLSFRLKQSI